MDIPSAEGVELYVFVGNIKEVVQRYNLFSGLLWSPEVRNCVNGEDLIRRMQTVCFSAQALINGWRIPGLPWKQTGSFVLYEDDFVSYDYDSAILA